MFPISSEAFARAILAGGCAISLVACEVRDTTGEDIAGEEALSDPQEEADDNPLTAPEAAVPGASIIRDDVEGDIVPSIPPEPVELILPFPDGANLTPQAEKLLQEALSSDALAEGWPVVLGGHTDSGGNDQANLRTARSRAETAAAWLVEQGVADERITVIAFGEQNPMAPNALPDGTPDEEGRRANRRVELQIMPPESDEEETEGEPAQDDAAPANDT